MLNILYSILKTLTLCLTVFGVGSAGFAPLNGAETLTGEVTPPGGSTSTVPAGKKAATATDRP